MLKIYYLLFFFILLCWISLYYINSFNLQPLTVLGLSSHSSANTFSSPLIHKEYVNDTNIPKAIILNFYDNPESQFINAKPILDKYGLKATFFVVCNWVESNHSKIPRMTWNEIRQLQQEGHDIESHTMNHISLVKLSLPELNYEIGQPVKCLSEHNINSTVFSPPHSYGWDNTTIIKTITKYYDHAIGGFRTPMYLNCHGWKLPTTATTITTTKFVSGTDCRTFLSNGTLNFSNRYDIKETSQDSLNIKYLGNQTKIYNEFIKLINNTVKLNQNNGHIVAIPIIGYHSIDNNNTNKSKDSTPTTLFEQEMKYLHDNNFKTITMTDILYNSTSNTFYLRNSTS